ncbi:hypothetical protein M413DRAFT_447753 [Hebeloma cylindrosporum]|uniref:Uncharacterized protein n=1 Tax=Hebeloma cylindrosporum TaxID=76867 RepID=A0A0C2YBZ6_HEBCY|nr:hypothetical protein M413DRAFT_447753 [Hebeloma cylindrosporum h7]
MSKPELPRTKGENYVPTPNDVFATRRYLLERVPAELANLILDEASYWPKVSSRVIAGDRNLIVSAIASENNDASRCCLLSPTLNEWITAEAKVSSSLKIKAVCFTIVSHDQGWASENNFSGKYEGSWTWFEAVIVRNFRQDILDQGLDDGGIRHLLEIRGGDAESPLVTTVTNAQSDSDTWHVQSNVRAHNQAVKHTILWSDKVEDDIDDDSLYIETGSNSGRGFVRSLEMGDRIAIIARAKYPGWGNYIEKIELEVYYSV